MRGDESQKTTLQNITKGTCTHPPGDLAAFVAFDSKTLVRENGGFNRSHGGVFV